MDVLAEERERVPNGLVVVGRPFVVLVDDLDAFTRDEFGHGAGLGAADREDGEPDRAVGAGVGWRDPPLGHVGELPESSTGVPQVETEGVVAEDRPPDRVADRMVQSPFKVSAGVVVTGVVLVACLEPGPSGRQVVRGDGG